VGSKTAQRLIMELKEKIADGKTLPEDSPAATVHTDVIDVLMALGYSRSEAQSALAIVPKELKGSEEKIRFALRSLAKQ
jgi:Holliday junction resolvasome RuvABC DNA-binding subunit